MGQRHAETVRRGNRGWRRSPFGNVDPGVVRRLERWAAQHGRSPEDEHRAILEQVLGKRLSAAPADEFWAKAAALRERVRGRRHTDSTRLIRNDRDRRAGPGG